MRICIVEDDLSVISILEDIVEREGLGTLCGDASEGEADLEQILALDPDIVLIDLLMPGKDGIQVVRELRERHCQAKFIMISQVSSKEMIAKAYTAGVEFFIQKPINLIEVRNVIRTVSTQIENERALKAIRSVFTQREAPQPPRNGGGEGQSGHSGNVPLSHRTGQDSVSDRCQPPMRQAQRVSPHHGAAGQAGCGKRAEPHRKPRRGGL